MQNLPLLSLELGEMESLYVVSLGGCTLHIPCYPFASLGATMKTLCQGFPKGFLRLSFTFSHMSWSQFWLWELASSFYILFRFEGLPLLIFYHPFFTVCIQQLLVWHSQRKRAGYCRLELIVPLPTYPLTTEKKNRTVPLLNSFFS